MKAVSYLYRLRLTSIKLEDIKEFSSLDDYQFDVLLSLAMCCEANRTDTVNKLTVEGFMNYYFRKITYRRRLRSFNELHELGYVWINSTRSVSITKLGRDQIDKAYNTLAEYEKSNLRAVLATLKNGRLGSDGIVSRERKDTLRKRVSDIPYTGVRREGAHCFRATINSKGKVIDLGTFTKPLAGAKARDAYIRKHKLKTNQLSLKHKS